MFMNSIKTGFLMFGLVFLFTFIGGLLGNQDGALIGLLIAGAMSFYSYWFSDKMVIKAYRAQEVDATTNPRLYNLVKKLSQNADLPMPKVYIIPERQPNAFATGRNPNHAAVACTQGLLDLMSDNELAGVVAHELGHVKHRDILISTIAATFAGAIANISRFLPYAGRSNNRDNRNNNGGLAILMALLAPLAASVIQMTISRRREFMADRAGAEISGNPLYLRDALGKLEEYSQRISMSNTRNPSTAHMFIVNPFAGLRGIQNLFRTHPSTYDRMRELEKLAIEKGYM
ncbi:MULTISPECIES: zinc metalloprotease HtpX [Fusobacterium]|uniref:zinc metalloprotease HtpX n=1 Tax=Fusobacterium TaxID=848 RepID=UPI0025C098F2|nr:zinc metalloprotease HtpX [Fusobacterium sp.]MCI7223862.1 zinc metalloprotease HtpX [Fusobacterium sp.]MDD7409613.1 zinc metalloprotease HtpX [Fusobacteriaceae bacterium]MDY5713328.1 zinc metalloprotease HtpX [Fusobacterium gastrosuis]